jgi:hypothetical protein
MTNTVQIEIKTNYGNEAIYPANDTAAKFANLVGKKTLSRVDLAIIANLGFDIVIKQAAFTI